MIHKQDYNAKLSDFGLAKDGPEGDKSHVSTRIMGTYGYAAPEYIMTGKLFCLNSLENISVNHPSVLGVSGKHLKKFTLLKIAISFI